MQVCGGSPECWCFYYSGGDGFDVEQARQSVLRPGVDHHPGCSGRVTITRPAHISTIQGNELINNPAYTVITENNGFWLDGCVKVEYQDTSGAV